MLSQLVHILVSPPTTIYRRFYRIASWGEGSWLCEMHLARSTQVGEANFAQTSDVVSRENENDR
jgi:hypothetical protein